MYVVVSVPLSLHIGYTLVITTAVITKIVTILLI